MPIYNHILPEHRLVYIENIGVITAEAVAKNYHGAAAMPNAHLVAHVLVDVRRISQLRAYFDGMAAVADMISLDGEDAPDPWNVAIVGNNTGHYPLLLDYAATVRRSGKMRCEVLKTIEEAIAWLDLPPAAAREVKALQDVATGSASDQSIDGTT